MARRAECAPGAARVFSEIAILPDSSLIKRRLVILISGRGSNMQALVQACRDQGWPAEVVAVIASRPDAAGLDWARAQGIAASALHHKEYASREAFDAALAEEIDRHAPDYVILAGFMRVLTPGFVNHFAGRLVNIHPSLLPAFPGLHTMPRRWPRACACTAAPCISSRRCWTTAPSSPRAACRCWPATRRIRWPIACWKSSTGLFRPPCAGWPKAGLR